MSNWQIELGLGALGLNDQQKATVEAAIPWAQALVKLINVNMHEIKQAQILLERIGPAAQIVADAIRAKEAGGG